MANKSFSLELNSKIKPFSKIIKVDSDKSLSIRSFLIASISQNISKVDNVLESEDVFSTISCLRKLGVKIKKKKNWVIFNLRKRLRIIICKKKLKFKSRQLGDGLQIANWNSFFNTKY